MKKLGTLYFFNIICTLVRCKHIPGIKHKYSNFIYIGNYG